MKSVADKLFVPREGTIVLGGRFMNKFMNGNHGEKYAWFPKIAIFKSDNLSLNGVKEEGIFVENPTGVYVLQFNASKEYASGENVIHSVKNGFNIANGGGGNMYLVATMDTLDFSKGYSSRWGIALSGKNNRGVLLYGKGSSDLKRMIVNATNKSIDSLSNKNGSNLLYNHCRAIDGTSKKCTINLGRKDIERIASGVLDFLPKDYYSKR